jgi:hypothetical protein
MDARELKKTVNNSVHKEWLSTLSLNLQFDVAESTKKLSGFYDVYQFYRKELNKWSTEELKIEHEPINSNSNYLKWCAEKMEAMLNSIVKDEDENSLERHWRDFANSRTMSNKGHYLKEFRETGFILELIKRDPETALAAHNYFLGEIDPHDRDKSVFEGRLLAYEFKTKELAGLVGRKDQDRKTLGQLRSDYERLVSDIASKSQEVLARQDEINEDFEGSRILMEESSKAQLKKYEDHFQETANKFIQDADVRFRSHEQTYEELLRLKKPVEYWDILAKKLYREAAWWLIGIIAAVLAGATLVIILSVSLTSEHIEKHIMNPAISIRWSILSLIFIGLIAYLIRVLTKMMMSNFHLYRDAQERKQLTYLYLSLINESAVSTEDRGIVLQSLFSRADSGLLKEDSSPTMPTIHLDKFNS